MTNSQMTTSHMCYECHGTIGDGDPKVTITFSSSDVRMWHMFPCYRAVEEQKNEWAVSEANKDRKDEEFKTHLEEWTKGHEWAVLDVLELMGYTTINCDTFYSPDDELEYPFDRCQNSILMPHSLPKEQEAEYLKAHGWYPKHSGGMYGDQAEYSYCPIHNNAEAQAKGHGSSSMLDWKKEDI